MTTQTMATPAMASQANSTQSTTGAVSARQIALDLGRSLVHAVMAGVLIGLSCVAVVALLATVSA